MPADPIATSAPASDEPAHLRWGLAVVLVVAALAVRWRTLTDDGLLFDDAWVVLGATGASAGDLLAVSTLHPGFTALLMAWARLVPDTTTWLSLPALLAGAALPAVVLWAGRRLDIRTGVAAAVAVVAVVAPTHVIYSGRVKPYTLEVLAILVLAVALGPLAARRWTVRVAAGWVVVAVLLGTLNAFALVAVGTAAVVLVLHPDGDRPVRAVAVAVQAAMQVLLLATMRERFDVDALESGWGDTFDGYVELSADVVGSAREVGTHLSRVGLMVVGNRWLALGIVLVAAAGLAAEAWRGGHVVVARYLFALPLVAFAGAVAERLPFGTIDQTVLFPGTRASLWLLPSVLVGLGFAGERAARAAARRGRAASAVLGVAAAALVAAVVAYGVARDVTYPSPGTETVATVVAARGDDDLVLVMETARWPLAAVEGSPFRVIPDRRSMVGFVVEPTDPAIEMVNPFERWPGSVPEARVEAGAAPGVPFERIFLVEMGAFDDNVDELHASLVALGYERVEAVAAGVSSVEVWALADGRPVS